MNGWTPVRARRLDEIAGPDGIIVGAAVDHRDSLRTALSRKGLPTPTDDALSQLKVRIARALSPASTVFLLDAEYGAAQALAVGALPGDVALVVPLEAQGYGDVAASPQTTFLAGWSPEKSALLGAAGCKLLLPYRTDKPEQADRQDEVVRVAVDGCRAAGVALILEPIVYGQPDADRFGELVVEGVARLSRLGPDILKVQHPGSADRCRALDAACGPDVPWVLLGGGASGADLERQTAEACAAGASGFIVGRTLWDVALVPDASEEAELLTTVSLPLFERLGAVAREYGTPWRTRVGEVAAPPAGQVP